ncbi:MAG: hypothetical protein LBG94_00920 [Treponema sp.]|jgi:hypothetical protein|nr:hypothetical protein [Treponema sp.]
MIAVKGKYKGMSIILDSTPAINECDVIVTFLGTASEVHGSPVSSKLDDDDSLAFLFRDYIDDGIREPIINFGRAVGNEQW